MKYNTIFWDWNGTIIDDLQASMDSVNALLSKRCLTTFATPDDYYKVFCFPVVEYYRKAGFDFSKEPFEVLAVEYIDNYNAICKNCNVFDDVRRALKTFKEQGVRQIILSASEHAGLVDWLAETDVLQYFDDVIGNDNIYAVGKADIALNWLDNQKEIDVKKALMIGDTTHDLEVASVMGVDSVAIARGHNSKEDLRACGVPVFDDAEQVLDYLFRQM